MNRRPSMLVGLLAAAIAHSVASAGPLPLAEQRRLAARHGYTVASGPDAPRPDEPAVKVDDACRRAAAAVFVRDYNLPIYPDGRIGQEELSAEADIFAARGEAEPLSLGVHALEDLAELTVSVGPLARADGAKFPADRVSVQYLEDAYIRSGRGRRTRGGGGGPTAVLMPLRLRPVAPLPLTRGTTRQFWITADVPTTCPAGEYRGTITVASAGRPALARDIRLVVRDYELAQPKDLFIGAFMTTGPGRPDRQTLADFKAHGIDAMLWFFNDSTWKIARDGDTIRQDFTPFKQFVDDAVAAGMKGPIVVALGNDYNGYYEKRLARLFDRPLRPAEDVGGKTAEVAAIDDPVVNRLYVEGIRQLSQFIRQQNGWPEIVLMHYDEATERLMPEAANRYKQIKQADPAMRVYGVAMSRLAWAEQVAPVSDILVCNGEFDAIRNLAGKLGKDVWGYTGCAASMGAGGARFNIGLRLYRYGLKGHWFWCYNFWPGDVWDEFDDRAGEADWVAVYPGDAPGKHTPTLAWEGIREGGDDIRYVATVRQLLAEKTGPTRDRVAAELDKFIREIPEGRDRTVFRADQTDFYATLPAYNRLTAMRRQLVEWIEQLRK